MSLTLDEFVYQVRLQQIVLLSRYLPWLSDLFGRKVTVLPELIRIDGSQHWPLSSRSAKQYRGPPYNVAVHPDNPTRPTVADIRAFVNALRANGNLTRVIIAVGAPEDLTGIWWCPDSFGVVHYTSLVFFYHNL